jgi:hypothetical protein
MEDSERVTKGKTYPAAFQLRRSLDEECRRPADAGGGVGLNSSVSHFIDMDGSATPRTQIKLVHDGLAEEAGELPPCPATNGPLFTARGFRPV